MPLSCNKNMNTSHNEATIANKNMSVKNLVLTGMFTAVLCVLAQINIPTQPIPFTLSLFAIFLIGALLSPRYAFMAILVYDLLGAFGIPVFAGLKGGFQVVIGPTGGYIIAYPIMGLITALFYKYFKKYKTAALLVGMLLSLVLCYLIGTLWFCFVTKTGFVAALALCVFPYVLFDCLKAVLAIGASSIIRKAVMR